MDIQYYTPYLCMQFGNDEIKQVEPPVQEACSPSLWLPSRLFNDIFCYQRPGAYRHYIACKVLRHCHGRELQYKLASTTLNHPCDTP